MNTEQNKQAVQEAYRMFQNGDVGSVVECCHEDTEWTSPDSDLIPISGTFHGKTEVMEHLGRLAEKSPTVNIKRLIAEGDTVVAITDVSAGGETGEDADVFTIRNGKTVRMEVHGDTALIERVYGKKQLAAG